MGRQRPVRTVAAVAVCVGAWAVPASSLAAVIKPDTRHDDFTNNGNCTLREAVVSANADTARDGCRAGDGADTVKLKAKTYRLSVAGAGEAASNTGDLDVAEALRIKGPSDGATVSAEGIDRVLDVHGPGGLTLENLRITKGVSPGTEHGGGVRITGPDPVVVAIRSTIDGNTAGGSGGGVYVEDSVAGPGFALVGINLTLAHNTALTATANGGGGLQAVGSTAVLLGWSTITGNSAQYGGGTHGVTGAIIRISAAVIAGNTATELVGPDCGGTSGVTSGNPTPNLIEDTTGCTINDELPADITGMDPLLLLLADNGGPVPTTALQPGSPAVNQGVGTDNETFPSITDARGVTRRTGDPIDLGAYELDYCLGEPVNRVGADNLLEARSNDVLKGTNALDAFLTFGGRDTAKGKAGGDLLCLGGGKDRGIGGPGKDRIDGGGGKDDLRGGTSKDVLIGGPGDDILNGGPGFDTCQGGPGRDREISCEA